MIQPFNGKYPKISSSAFISDTAHIIGDVEIGKYSSVWPGAVIRGDFGKISIGEMTSVEDNCVIHSGSPNSQNQDVVIGNEVHIGHGAVINCQRIGNNVLIGMNATILHDVEIENYCIIGASCLITTNMKIPEDSFVAGVPGKIKGHITKDQSFWIKKAPQVYYELSKKYKQRN